MGEAGNTLVGTRRLSTGPEATTIRRPGGTPTTHRDFRTHAETTQPPNHTGPQTPSSRKAPPPRKRRSPRSGVLLVRAPSHKGPSCSPPYDLPEGLPHFWPGAAEFFVRNEQKI
nr:hypothetical protein GCM10017745_72710 [Saccharothrix mutabilis subsp. capreolus]